MYNGFQIIRARYHAGHLQLLLSILTTSQKVESKVLQNFWWNFDRYAGNHDITDSLLGLNIEICGSPQRMLKQLFPLAQRK